MIVLLPINRGILNMGKINRSEGVINNNQNTPCNSAELLHNDLSAIKDLVYIPVGFQCSQPIKEAESAEYGAYAFQLNGLSIRFRVAKVTPTKAGQFVTLWKRTGNGPIQPYDINDQVDFFVICTRKENYFGQFVFPKSVLRKHDVISVNGKGGKRAIRVYPSWETSLNREAQKTQSWQIEYFLDIPQNDPIDCYHVRKLFSLN